MPRDADKLEGDAVPRDRDRDRDDKDRRSRRRRRDSDTGDVDRDRDRDRDHDRRRRRDDDASRQDGKDEGRERRSRRSDPKDGSSKDDSAAAAGDATAASSTPAVTVEVQGGAAVSTADIADLLQPWAADVVRVRLNAAPEKEDGRQVHSVEVASREAARRISEHFESSAGRRSELNGQRVRVSDARRERRSSRKEGESDRGDRSTRDSGRREDSRRERGGEKSSSSRRDSEKERSGRSDRGGDRGGRDHRDRDRDRDYARRVAAPVKPKMPPPITLLAEKFPHMSVVALSSSDSMLVSIHAEDIEETDGAVSHLTAKRKHPQEKPPRRTVCLNYIKESRCRFGSSCQYIHALASAEREELLCVRRRTDDDKEDAVRPRPQRKPQPKFNPTEVPMLDDADAAPTAAATAAAQQQPVVAHYETTLLVRDVDRDTAARGVRQMTEDDFRRMWSEIDGFVGAQLVREGEKVKLYRGAYGLVAFETPEDAADALAQTFGCGLNVSFYGTEEILEEVTAEQQQILALKKRK